jgi:putative endonuclease
VLVKKLVKCLSPVRASFDTQPRAATQDARNKKTDCSECRAEGEVYRGEHEHRKNNMPKFYVYILKCSDGSFYTGHTDDLERRISEHQAGTYLGYTSKLLPVQLVYAEALATRVEALAAEQKIKGWTRAKKLALIQSNWSLISDLAKKKF